MDDIIKIFDSLLTLIVSFPVTIFQVLISPDKVVGVEPGTLISPPGATLVISFIIWHFAHSKQAQIRYSLELPFMPGKEDSILQFIFIIFVLVVQCLVLLIPWVVPGRVVDAIKIVQALTYPVSVFLTVNGLVYLIYILFPIGAEPHGMTIEERLSPAMRKIRQKPGARKRIVADENADSLARLAGMLVYMYALYNILAGLFQLSIGRTVLATIVLLFSSSFAMMLFWYTFSRLDGLVDKLKTQEEAMPEKKKIEEDV